MINAANNILFRFIYFVIFVLIQIILNGLHYSSLSIKQYSVLDTHIFCSLLRLYYITAHSIYNILCTVHRRLNSTFTLTIHYVPNR